jgi:hypothetical protein
MARIPEAEIERLKEAVPVVRLVEASGIELTSGSGLASCLQPLDRPPRCGIHWGRVLPLASSTRSPPPARTIAGLGVTRGSGSGLARCP